MQGILEIYCLPIHQNNTVKSPGLLDSSTKNTNNKERKYETNQQIQYSIFHAPKTIKQQQKSPGSDSVKSENFKSLITKRATNSKQVLQERNVDKINENQRESNKFDRSQSSSSIFSLNIEVPKDLDGSITPKAQMIKIKRPESVAAQANYSTPMSSIIYDTAYDPSSSSTMSLVDPLSSSTMSLVDSSSSSTMSLADSLSSSTMSLADSSSSFHKKEGIMNSPLDNKSVLRPNVIFNQDEIDTISKNIIIIKDEMANDLPGSNEKIIPHNSTINLDSEYKKSNVIPDSITQKLVVNDIKVIHNILNITMDEFINELENDFFKNKAIHLKEQVEKAFKKKYDLFEKHLKLQEALDQTRSRINKIENELLEVKENHHNVCMDMSKERESFRNEEEERKKCEKLHVFLSNIEIFRELFLLKNVANAEDSNRNDLNVGRLVGIITNIILRSGDELLDSSHEQGYLGKIRRFNELLETLQETLEKIKMTY
ncbi:3901_t:CDS:10 [Entrophospora sp. SA101]|nr:3901_t:CDS:10 [Entrophospora sp. SA101]